MTLDAHWDRAWSDLGVPAPPLRDALLARYREPHRAYHTVQHLTECLDGFERVRDLAERPGEVAVALWFHDAIYDTQAHDNEQRSADWAREVVGGDAGDRIHALVLATKHDAVPAPGDPALLVDLDLSILGAAPARFDEYEVQVRQEYAWVPDDAFRAGRAAILRQFLDRQAIYGTPRLHARLEAQARANLTRALARLGSYSG